jgi:hypothetical protein
MTVRRVLAMVAVVLMALFVVPTSAAHAAADNRDNCRGFVALIYTSGSNVVAEYRILCDRSQTSIHVSADVVRHTSGLPTERAGKTCYNVRLCSVTPKISNPSGLQLFSGSVFSAVAKRSGYNVGCGAVAEYPITMDGLMNCSADDKRL